MGDTPKKPKANKQKKQTGAFQGQAISQADSRQNKSGVAMPNAENVQRNKNWVDQNEK